MVRCKRRYLAFPLTGVLLYCLCYYIGVEDYINARDISDVFDYPLNVNISPLIQQVIEGMEPSIKPINNYPYSFLTNSDKCSSKNVYLLILVKSATDHFKQRIGIRKTWGNEHDSIPDHVVKVVFFLGFNESPTSKVQQRIDEEIKRYKDVIQMDFIDAYFNNTIKTMMTFRWAYQNCPSAEYYLFSDDDMYINVRNLIDYTQNSKQYNPSDNKNNEVIPRDVNSQFYAGFVFKSRPQRFRSSKWRVPLVEYPWNQWPPYVTAGAYVVNNKSLKTLYIGSLFVKHFRFDDIYLAIVAKKVGIVPQHCEEFYFYKKRFSVESYKNVIASHGYSDPNELMKAWVTWRRRYLDDMNG